MNIYFGTTCDSDIAIFQKIEDIDISGDFSGSAVKHSYRLSNSTNVEKHSDAMANGLSKSFDNPSTMMFLK